MHPVLRQMRPSPPVDRFEGESEGIARLSGGGSAPVVPESHPRVQLKREAAEAYVPPENVFRDRDGEEGEGARHARFESGRALRKFHDHQRVLTEQDFEKDPGNGISRADGHLKTADMITAYEQTVRDEVNFQTTFNNNVRALVARQEVTVGLMHLWDFVQAYLENPSSKSLTAQLFLIVQHSRDEGVLRESLLNIAEPQSRWLVDLINILQTIIVQERGLSISEEVAAINYSVIELSKHYARKIFKSVFVPIDKEAKINTFYMRIVVKLLVLCDDLGMYRNERIERVVSGVRRRELNDRDLMFSLQRALATSGADEEELEAFDYGDDLEPAEPHAPRSAMLGAGSLHGSVQHRAPLARREEAVSDSDAYDSLSLQPRYGRRAEPGESGCYADSADPRRRVGGSY